MENYSVRIGFEVPFADVKAVIRYLKIVPATDLFEQWVKENNGEHYFSDYRSLMYVQMKADTVNENGFFVNVTFKNNQVPDKAKKGVNLFAKALANDFEDFMLDFLTAVAFKIQPTRISDTMVVNEYKALTDKVLDEGIESIRYDSQCFS